MGYLKYKNPEVTWGGGLISTENVVSVRLNGDSINIVYSDGYMLTIEQDGSGFSQDDINTIIKGVNILNGSSGSNLDIELSEAVYDVYASAL